ncbi:hypothetical protein Gotur_013390 [Gossypium turneri]
MTQFREALEEFNLHDLGFSGRWFTWERGRLPENNIRERIDRGVANSVWWGDISTSIETSKLGKNFKFNANWVMEDGYDETLAEMKKVKLALNLEADKEEFFWEQRARLFEEEQISRILSIPLTAVDIHDERVWRGDKTANTFVADATTAEARACLQTVVVPEELGFRNLVVEGDSLATIKKIQTLEEDKSNITVIIKEIREQTRRFDSFSCQFTGRLVNYVAHLMAEEEKRWDSPRFWIEEAPPRTESAVEKDRKSLSER